MNQQKVAILIEALPYIKKFAGKTFVIKYGGSIMNNEKSKKAFIEDVVLMNLVGIRSVIVHGGGPNISQMLDRLQIQSEFINGLRVTTKEAIEVVEMVLSGHVNKEISSDLCKHGISAIGLSGRDSNLIRAKKKYLYKEGNPIDLGYVGEVTNVNSKFILELLERNRVPVISPIGSDIGGNIYNINADYVASAVSAAIKAEKLILLTDVEGIYEDVDDPSSLISMITLNEVDDYIQKEIISGGMIPKIQCCVQAIEGGTQGVHLIDGRREHSLLLEIFTHSGIGTMIKGGNK
jgi:acetylglutamate kinase